MWYEGSTVQCDMEECTEEVLYNVVYGGSTVQCGMREVHAYAVQNTMAWSCMCRADIAVSGHPMYMYFGIKTELQVSVHHFLCVH